MRFDDRLSTVLAASFDSPRARALRWQQLTDIVAQAGADLPVPLAERLLRMIALLARDVQPAVLAAQAGDVAARSSYAPLVVLLARLGPASAEAAILSARLTEQEWLAALPDLGPLGRALLRQRANMPAAVQQGLRLFAAADMTLAQPDAATAGSDQQPTDIRDLVRRIEEYRQRQSDQGQGVRVPQTASPVTRFRFVTDAAARIIDAEVRGRGRFVGLELSQPAVALEGGCDAGTARMVGKRQPIYRGRLLVTGGDMWAGTWLCDAEPRFASINGAFLGYVGTLRRPEPDEVAPQRDADTHVAPPGQFSPELLRQLMHELRSPLNAVAGFAQLIEGQYAGPVAAVYRSAAATILAETDSLNGVIDEIDLLAQLSDESDQADEAPESAALDSAIDAVLAGSQQGRYPAIALKMDGAAEGIAVRATPSALVKLLRLWLQPLGRAGPATAPALMHLAVRATTENVRLILDRPANADRSPLPAPDPALGFAFATAERLARELGGSLEAGEGQHILNLPVVAQTGASGEQVG